MRARDKNFDQKLAEVKTNLVALDQDLKILADLIDRYAQGEDLSQDDLIANDNQTDVLDAIGDLDRTSEMYWHGFAYSQVQIAIDKFQATIFQIDILKELQKRLPVSSDIQEDITLHQLFADKAHKWISDTLPFLRNKGASTKEIDSEVLLDSVNVWIEGQESAKFDASVGLETREDLFSVLDEGKLKIIELSLVQMVERINMALAVLSNFIESNDRNIEIIEQHYPHLKLGFVSETLDFVGDQIGQTKTTIAEIDSRLGSRYISSPMPVYALDLKY